MIIPSYWGRKKTDSWKETDDVYDHPTPLDEKGTLSRVLKSLSVLKSRDFNLVVLGISTAEDIQADVESRISSILKEESPEVQTFLLSNSHLEKIHRHLSDQSLEKFIPLLKLSGYSNVRNLCLFSAHLLGSEVAVLIDDDEIFEDPFFMEKALEYIGEKKNKEEKVIAVAGYYINPDNDFYINKEIESWMTYWNKIDCMNRAFKEIISKPPRLKETPFVFGGNMVVHENLFTQVPFDPSITRGEDIDFLINARMFGHKFYLDNELSIKHDAPPKAHPAWRKVREDVLRFVFERNKLEEQEAVPGMKRITAEDLEPFPGEFLKEDLQDRIFHSNIMLAVDYLRQDDKRGAVECLNNINLAKTKFTSETNSFQNLIQLQKIWKDLMGYFSSENVRQDVCRQINYLAE